MVNFFDYLYYRICKFYYKNGGSNPKITALVILALIHFFNLLSLLAIVRWIIDIKIEINKLYAIPIILLILVIDGLRYNKYNYDVLNNKWADEKLGKKIKKGYLVISYVFFSIIACFILGITVGFS